MGLNDNIFQYSSLRIKVCESLQKVYLHRYCKYCFSIVVIFFASKALLSYYDNLKMEIYVQA